ncbi:hypothetical protein CYY_007440 [Polysphondylium violaceum]|uniref:Uncharacterized protein n=1 Tax=Polysphondylium violaceum TaxID=133409 RepID=A0A8J4PP88_9MYCE|nr:hypothetical protein CYY_007440 [Polysphondylium violaceum]
MALTDKILIKKILDESISYFRDTHRIKTITVDEIAPTILNLLLISKDIKREVIHLNFPILSISSAKEFQYVSRCHIKFKLSLQFSLIKTLFNPSIQQQLYQKFKNFFPKTTTLSTDEAFIKIQENIDCIDQVSDLMFLNDLCDRLKKDNEETLLSKVTSMKISVEHVAFLEIVAKHFGNQLRKLDSCSTQVQLNYDYLNQFPKLEECTFNIGFVVNLFRYLKHRPNNLIHTVSLNSFESLVHRNIAQNISDNPTLTRLSLRGRQTTREELFKILNTCTNIKQLAIYDPNHMEIQTDDSVNTIEITNNTLEKLKLYKPGTFIYNWIGQSILSTLCVDHFTLDMVRTHVNLKKLTLKIDPHSFLDKYILEIWTSHDRLESLEKLKIEFNTIAPSMDNNFYWNVFIKGLQTNYCKLKSLSLIKTNIPLALIGDLMDILPASLTKLDIRIFKILKIKSRDNSIRAATSDPQEIPFYLSIISILKEKLQQLQHLNLKLDMGLDLLSECILVVLECHPFLKSFTFTSFIGGSFNEKQLTRFENALSKSMVQSLNIDPLLWNSSNRNSLSKYLHSKGILMK